MAEFLKVSRMTRSGATSAAAASSASRSGLCSVWWCKRSSSRYGIHNRRRGILPLGGGEASMQSVLTLAPGLRGAPPPGTGSVRHDPAPTPAPDSGPADGGAKTLRKPVFTTVDQLRPQTHGHTLTARVITARTVFDKPSTHLGCTRVAECLVRDSTGTILVTARNEQGGKYSEASSLVVWGPTFVSFSAKQMSS